MFRTSLTVVLCALTASSAWAVQPPEGVRPGAEPTRVRTYDEATQDYFARRAAWTTFTDGEGAGWEARFDQVTGTPHRMWGRGIDLGPLKTGTDVSKAVLAFARRHAELLGIGKGQLVVAHATHVERMNAWYAHIDVEHDGLKVWRSGITFRIKHNRLVMVGADTYPHAPIEGAFSLSADEAVQAFIDLGPASRDVHTDVSTEPVLLPEVRMGRPVLRGVWLVRTTTASPMGKWEGFIDSDTGELVTFFNTIRFFEGQIDAVHDARIGDGTLEQSPLRNAVVSTSTDTVITDDEGRYSIPDDEAGYSVLLSSGRVRVRDEAAGFTTPTITEPVVVLDAPDWGERLAPVTTFLAVQEVQDFAYGLAPEVGWTRSRTDAFVNIDDSCNAWFDGDINFLRSGGGCRNTGRLKDVIFHEWGHGFHAYSVVTGSYDGSVGEGAADTMSFLMTDDSAIAPSFFTQGGPLRDTNNRRRYPEDNRASEDFIHSNGLIFGGSMWDSREALRATYGEPYATQTLAAIYAGLLKGGPDLETAYDEAVFADDDNGDLSDGTPHQCELVEGFGKHGLGPVGGFGVSPEPIGTWTMAADADAVITLDIPNPAPTCFDVSPTGGTLHYRVNGDAWQQADFSASGRQVSALIPQAELRWGDVVTYWSEVVTDNGATVTEPSQGPIRPHTFHVGDVLKIKCNTFEKNTGGFTHRLLGGDDVEGADDWTAGEPMGLYGDPPSAYSGERVWGNDLGGGEFNGAYQDGKHNQLRSPVYDTAHYQGVFLQYMRWLTVEDGVFDKARILADEAEVWTNWSSGEEAGTDHHLDDRWEPHVVHLDGLGDDGSLQLAWEIESDPGVFFGGWNIDDVCIYAPATADNRLGIGDFVATRTGGDVNLSFTTPRHAPFTEVKVVRKQGDWPTSVTDGEVVFEATGLELEAPVTAVDPTRDVDLYYAVYASDGDTWLSWTREGFNAAAVDALPPGASLPGCSCDSTGPRSVALWLPLLGLLGLRRRQR